MAECMLQSLARRDMAVSRDSVMKFGVANRRCRCGNAIAGMITNFAKDRREVYCKTCQPAVEARVFKGSKTLERPALAAMRARLRAAELGIR